MWAVRITVTVAKIGLWFRRRYAAVVQRLFKSVINDVLVNALHPDFGWIWSEGEQGARYIQEAYNEGQAHGVKAVDDAYQNCTKMVTCPHCNGQFLTRALTTRENAIMPVPRKMDASVTPEEKRAILHQADEKQKEHDQRMKEREELLKADPEEDWVDEDC